MKLEFKITNKDYLEFNLFHMDNSDQFRKSLLVSRVLLTFIIIGVAFLAMHGNTERHLIGYTYFAVLWVLIMAFFNKGFRGVVKKRIEKMIEEGKNSGFVGNYVLTLSDEGINVITDNNVMKTKWVGIERIAENQDYIFIYVGAVAAYIIPANAFTDSNQKEEFKNTLNAMINRSVHTF